MSSQIGLASCLHTVYGHCLYNVAVNAQVKVQTLTRTDTYLQFYPFLFMKSVNFITFAYMPMFSQFFPKTDFHFNTYIYIYRIHSQIPYIYICTMFWSAHILILYLLSLIHFRVLTGNQFAKSCTCSSMKLYFYLSKFSP